jgi:hypothetical protein
MGGGRGRVKVSLKFKNQNLFFFGLTGGSGASEASEASDGKFYFFLTFPPTNSRLLTCVQISMNSWREIELEILDSQP